MKTHHRLSQSRKGTALVLTLAVVSILSVMLVFFLVTAQLDNQSTENYSQGIRAQDLGVSGLQEIIGTLRTEIKYGSKVTDIGGVTIYTPKSGATAFPYRRGFTKAEYGIDAESTSLLPPTLVAVSRYNTVYPADYTPTGPALETPASNLSTATPSRGGRNISPERWNNPRLLAAADGTVPAPFSSRPPDWIFVRRDGSKVCTDEEATAGAYQADFAGAKPKAILGRYAYVIYDEAGLLDVNVAGYEKSTKDTFPEVVSGKSYLSYADLNQLPGLTSSTGLNLIDSLIGWRNQGGKTSLGDYVSLVNESATEGFRKFHANDNPLLTRQDLIDYFTLKVGNPGALPYLGTFSRAVNAPSWGPTAVTPNVNYPANADSAASENRNIPNVREASTGQPLVKRRFPLTHLALVTHTADKNSPDAEKISQYFGLERNTAADPWRYNHGDANNIKTLEEVGAAGREPDFFELLKAVILDGSLGRDPGYNHDRIAEIMGRGGSGGNGVNAPMGAFYDTYSAIPDHQILQIGANIIDQYDADSYPTAIYQEKVALAGTGVGVDRDRRKALQHLENEFNTVYGVENLPYLYSLRGLVWRDTVQPTSPLPAGRHHGWFQPAMWNPHQQIKAADLGARPTEFRIHAYGRMEVTEWGRSPLAPGYYNYEPASPTAPAPTTPGAQFIQFQNAGGNSSAFYAKPVFLTSTAAGGSASSPSADNQWQAMHGASHRDFVAFYAGSIVPNGASGSYTNGGFIMGANDPYMLHYVVEYRDTALPGAPWRPYTRLARLFASQGHGVTWANATTTQIFGNADISRPDPRTDRFSVSLGWSGVAANGDSFWPSRLNHKVSRNYMPSNSRGFVITPAPSSSEGQMRAGLFARNDPQLASANNLYYSDPDGVVRPGDAYRVNENSGDGAITFHAGSAEFGHSRRPVILNRAFRSVGELGYAFRDLPFKTLDFWSKDSADAGLLDVFCLVEEPAVVAGQINPNSAAAPVLRAVLAGASKKEIDPSLRMDAEVQQMGADIAAYLRDNGPLLNRAELVTHTPAGKPGVSLSNTLNLAFSTNPDRANKPLGEAPIRALAPVTNTRTWNLLIDLISQAGRIPPNGKKLADFVVEGEKRYWLHVAIDRYTGKVIDQQLETVYE